MIKWCHNKTHHSGRQLYELLQSSFFTKAECIYHDQIGDLMLRRPNAQATRWLLSDQISLCDQIGDQITAVTKMEVKLAADQNGNQIPVMVIWSEMIDMLI